MSHRRTLVVAWTLITLADLGSSGSRAADIARVGPSDFVAFQGCFSGPGTALPLSACAIFDYDQSGHVDLADFQCFQSAFDAGLEPSPTTMQEPSADDLDADAVYTTGGVVFHNGELRVDRLDLMIPGRGQCNFTMMRRYRSRLHYHGPLGFGWDYPYNERLYLRGNGDVIRSNGLGHLDTWTRNPDGSYSAPTGHFRQLIRRADGTYVLRSPDGYKRTYDIDGRLIRYTDRNGNQMAFLYDARRNLDVVVDPFGREIDFVFEPFAGGIDRLTRIIDFAGREVVYSYDAQGDLVARRSPIVTGTSTGNDFPAGRTEQYAYTSGSAEPELNHNLTAITYPQEVADGGPPAVTIGYGTNAGDPVTFDRVLLQVEGGTNASGVPAGGTRTYDYTPLNESEPPGDLSLPRLKVLLTERNGNELEVFVNEVQHAIMVRRLTQGLRPGEPPFYQITSTYDGDGQLVQRVLPAGSSRHYVYDATGPRRAQRNLLEVRVAAGPLGGGEDIVGRFTYEPLYQQLLSATDPRGNALAFVPPIGTASAARYTAHSFFDYQEGSDPIPDALEFGIDLSGVPRGLGDINSDGRTDQIAGKPVRIDAPNVELLPDSNEAAQSGDTTQEISLRPQWNDRGQLVRVIDAKGHIDTFEYNPENDPDGDGTLVMNSTGVLMPSGDPTGYIKATTIDAEPSASPAPPAMVRGEQFYDAVGNVVRVRNPRGVTFEFELNPLNEVVRLTRGADVADAVASGQLITGEAAFAYLTRWFRDFNGRVTRLEIENRDSTTPGVGEFVERTYTYDILDNALSAPLEVDAATTVTMLYGYDANELPTLVQAPEGNKLRVTYDERNFMFTRTRGADTPEAATITCDYDLNGNILRITDAEDTDGDGAPESVLFAHDGFDRLVQATDPLGNQALITYDVASNIVRRRFMGHPAGQPQAPPVLLADVTFSHDELYRTFQVDRSLFLAAGFNPLIPVDLRDHNNDGFVTARAEFDALSRNTFAVEDDLEVTRAIYDGADRLIELIDAAGNRRKIQYDQNSNPVEVRSIELATGNIVLPQEFIGFYVYDQLDRLVRVAADHTYRLSYDSRDNVVAVSDAQGPVVPDDLGLPIGTMNNPGNTATYFYDGRDLLTSVVSDLRVDGQGGNPLDVSNPFNSDGQVTLSFTYDGNARRTAMTDDSGNVTQYVYDALDRLTDAINADLTQSTLVYDRDSNVLEETDPAGNLIENTFDALNRIVQQQITPVAGVEGTLNQTFAYDGLSRLTEATDDNGGTPHSIQRIYDSLSRLLEQHQDAAVFSSVWSGDGKRVSVQYPGGRLLESTYDAIDRQVGVAEAGTSIIDYAWIGSGGGRLLKRTHGNGTYLSFLNDAENTDIGYDEFQRIARLRHIFAESVQVDRDYEYNRANQRTQELRLDDAMLADLYTYDSLYRLVSTDYDATGAPPGDLLQTQYTYDGVGNRRQVTSDTVSMGTTVENYAVNEMNEYTQQGPAAQQHDHDGNLTHNGQFRYVFDYSDRLIRVHRASDDALLASYEYDVFNRRVRKSVFDPDNPGAPHVTRYLYDGWREVEEQDATGATQVTYVYGVGIDEPVQMLKTAAAPGGAGEFYLHPNARGDIVAVTNAMGAVVERFRYTDFGQPDVASTIGMPYLFQSRRLDPETGLYYFRHRYYDPAAGRFIHRDPVFDPANMGNQYTFAGNRPVSGSDPLGLNSWGETLGLWKDHETWSQTWQRHYNGMERLVLDGYWRPGIEFFSGSAETAAEPWNLARDAEASVAEGLGYEKPKSFLGSYEQSMDYPARHDNFRSMTGKSMEAKVMADPDISGVRLVAEATAEAAVTSLPPVGFALGIKESVEAIAEGDMRKLGRGMTGAALSGLDMAGTAQHGHGMAPPREPLRARSLQESARLAVGDGATGPRRVSDMDCGQQTLTGVKSVLDDKPAGIQDGVDLMGGKTGVTDTMDAAFGFQWIARQIPNEVPDLSFEGVRKTVRNIPGDEGTPFVILRQPVKVVLENGTATYPNLGHWMIGLKTADGFAIVDRQTGKIYGDGLRHVWDTGGLWHIIWLPKAPKPPLRGGNLYAWAGALYRLFDYAFAAGAFLRRFTDEDFDEVEDPTDNCPRIANPAQEDDDDDGVGNACDNCPNHANSFQSDDDHDTAGNACDLCAGTPSGTPVDSNGCSIPTTPPNDDSCNATPIGPGTAPFNTNGATTDGPDAGEGCSYQGDSQIGSDIWYCITPATSGMLMVSTCPSDFNAKIAVYDGCGAPNGNLIGCSAYSCPTGGQQGAGLSLFGYAGQSYLIRIGGVNGAQGTGMLNVAIPPFDTYDIALFYQCNGQDQFLTTTFGQPQPCLGVNGDGVIATCGSNMFTGAPIGVDEVVVDYGNGSATVKVTVSSLNNTALLPNGLTCGGAPITVIGADLGKQLVSDDFNPQLGVGEFDILEANAVVYGTNGNILLQFPLNSQGTTDSVLEDRFTVGGANAVPISALQFQYFLQTGPSRGACCVAEDACFSNTTPDGCTSLSGDYAGDFSDCAEIQCGPPANDDCSGAQLIGSGVTCFDLSQATLDAGSAPCDPDMQTDVWYRYTATCTGMLTVNTCTGTVGPDTVLEVYGGSGTPACPPMGSPAPLACNDNSGCGVGGAASSMTQSVTTGQSFLIRLGAGAAGATTGDLLVSCVPAVGTSGACCVGTGCQTVSQTSCTSLGGTFQGTGTRCGVFVPFTAVSTAARVHTCNSNYDTLVRILDGCGGNVLAENDNCSASSSGSDPNAPCFNAPGVTTSCLCFPSQPGATYFVQILFAPGGPPPPGSSTSFSIIHTTDCGG